MSFPEFAQELERALGQRDVTVGVAFAAANVEQPPLGIDVADFQLEAFTEPQAAGVDRGQGNPMIQCGDRRENPAHFARSQDHGQFELARGADQDQFVRPFPAERFFPKQFDGANRLGGRLPGDLLDRLQMNEVLAELFGRQEVRSLAVMLAQMDDTGMVSFLRALGQGEQRKVIGEGV